MRAFCILILLSLSDATPVVRQGKLQRSRKAKLGPSLDEVDFNYLEPQLKVLNKGQIDESTRQIRQRIEQINAKLTEAEKETLIAESNKEDPIGYNCDKQILNITEVTFVEQVRCYNTTEEVCSMTQKTVFEPRTEKRCDIHFKKECWIDYKEQSQSQMVNICTTKPERKCDLTPAEKENFAKDECNTYYETVCQTQYTEKEVVEDRPICNDILELMCDDNDENCMQFTRKECKTQKVTTLKAIPNTSCEQKSQEICVTPACPLVVENKVCQDVEKTFIAMVPKESCELHPREVCTDIVKQYPSLQMVSDCQYLPRETCSPERVQPKEVTRPVIKKVCTAIDGEPQETSPTSPGAQGDTGVPPIVICPGDTVDANGMKQTNQGNECRCPPGTEDDRSGTNTCIDVPPPFRG